MTITIDENRLEKEFNQIDSMNVEDQDDRPPPKVCLLCTKEFPKPEQSIIHFAQSKHRQKVFKVMRHSQLSVHHDAAMKELEEAMRKKEEEDEREREMIEKGEVDEIVEEKETEEIILSDEEQRIKSEIHDYRVNYMFWCSICNQGVNSERMLVTHKQSPKHKTAETVYNKYADLIKKPYGEMSEEDRKKLFYEKYIPPKED
ncbi:hypothetical protein SNEBB_006286 [Seison nebaliae]|nr:hypothetical protein SNEBB_006286 [Seison nebaliae]